MCVCVQIRANTHTEMNKRLGRHCINYIHTVLGENQPSCVKKQQHINIPNNEVSHLPTVLGRHYIYYCFDIKKKLGAHEVRPYASNPALYIISGHLGFIYAWQLQQMHKSNDID